jgi:hypothetical protein
MAEKTASSQRRARAARRHARYPRTVPRSAGKVSRGSLPRRSRRAR